MKRILGLVAGIIAVYLVALQVHEPPGRPAERGYFTEAPGAESLVRAFEHRARGVQVEGEGEVIRVLADDGDGSRHQRFIVRLASGQTVLVAHNIDLAPRVEGLVAGDGVAFYGQYEWNERGGVVHWTHRDPRGGHAAGWVRHDGRLYQ
jgi:hypothetical protein